MPNTKTVLYIYPHPATFVHRDIKMLAEVYQVIGHAFYPSGGLSLVFRFVKQFLFLLFNIHKADVIICMFMGYHSFLPTLFCHILKKPTIGILGGTECHNYPSINYGSLRKPLYRWFTRISFRNCTHLAPVHESLVLFSDNYYGVDYPKQGYQYFFPEVKAPYTAIYNGYDDNAYKPISAVRKPNSFLTVAGTFEGGEFYRKGADLIIEVAKAFPHFDFTMIGNQSGFPSLPNLVLLPAMPAEELIQHFNAHEFYFQLSIAEGFPNALCEAMLCGCIPIGSAVYGIPDIIGETGFILNHKSIDELKQVISQAVVGDKKFLAQAARNRIQSEFPHSRRQRELIQLVEKVSSNHSS